MYSKFQISYTIHIACQPTCFYWCKGSLSLWAMSKMLTLQVRKRDILGKKVKALRKEDKIPAVLYGPKIKSFPLAIEYKDFERVYKEAGGASLIELDIVTDKEGENNKDGENIVLIREAKVHPVNQRFTHVDFYQLPLDKVIEITVPIRGENEAPAVKTEGGILVQNMHEMNIRALPQKLINEILVDISTLEHVGDSIIVKDISVGADIELMMDVDSTTIFSVEAPRVEEAEEIVGEEDNQISEIKTEGEEKREEGDEEGEEGVIASEQATENKEQ